MPLVFAESEVTGSGILYEDRTGVSYQYPNRYRRMIQPGERFVYYRGRRKRDGGRAPQVYFGTGVVGRTAVDLEHPDRSTCAILDYQPFLAPVPFRDSEGTYLETGAQRRGYFQPGVRRISEPDFRRILDAASASLLYAPDEAAQATDHAVIRRTAYASEATLRPVEDFAMAVALGALSSRYDGFIAECQPRNNPGFDILVRPTAGPGVHRYVEVKGTTREFPQFFMTEGELQFSRRNADRFELVVVYKIRLDLKSYEVFWYEGPVTIDAGFQLQPVQWACEAIRKSGRRSQTQGPTAE